MRSEELRQTECRVQNSEYRMATNTKQKGNNSPPLAVVTSDEKGKLQ